MQAAQAVLLAASRTKRVLTPSFSTWLNESFPEWHWDWKHLVFVREHLDKVTRGEIKRLILELPPRHGKTEMVTVRYPIWMLKRRPEMRVVVGAYNQMLANRFSRRARRIAEQHLEIRRDRAAVEEWETTADGSFRAVGVGAGITGQGADLIIIDDPVKNRREANSEAYRDMVWDWYRDDIYTRLEPGAAIILIMTRWHEDDLAGRILASDDGDSWTEVKLPAEAEANDPLGRQEKAALCPERYNEETLAKIRKVLGLSYYALYQQRPQPAEGGMFKREWFDIVREYPRGGEFVRYWDKAGTEDDGAYTAGVLFERTQNGIYYVIDVKRDQLSALQRERLIKQTAELDKQLYGNVRIWIEQEPGSGGKESAEATIRNLAGYVARAERVTGDKPTRAEQYSAQCEAGNVKLVAGAWNNAFIDEHAAFPTGTYMDQVDASAGAFNKLAIPDTFLVYEAWSEQTWPDGNVTEEARYRPNAPVYWACEDGYSYGEGPGYASYHPRVVLFMQDNEYGGFDVIDEYVACEETHDVTLRNIRGGRNGETADETRWHQYHKPSVAFIPGEAALFKGELHKWGISTVNSQHRVVEGIKAVRQLIKGGDEVRRLRVNPICQQVIHEISLYRSDLNDRAEQGEVVPIPIDDGAMDALRQLVFKRRHTTG